MPKNQNIYSFTDDFDDLIHITEPFEVISFDIFDTLVYRPIVNPKSLFELTERKLVVTYGGQYVNFAIYRILAENEARRKASVSGFEEVTLDEIYQEVQKLFEDEGQKNLNLELAKQLEQELEIQYIQPISKAKDFVNTLVENGKKVIFISDMYLPKDTIINMLLSAGYALDNIDIYVSCDYRLSKHHGNLYKWVLEVNNWHAEAQIHFGDNHHSDIHQAQHVGIQAVALKTLAYANYQHFGHGATIAYKTEQLQQSVGLGLLQYRRDCKILPTYTDNQDYYWYLLGYNFIGSMMVSLSLWLNEQAQGHESEKILFLARDGQIVKEVYDILFRQQNHIASEYCYGSRRMISLPFAAVNPWNLYLFYEDIIKNSKNFNEALAKIPGGAQLAEIILEHTTSLTDTLRKNKPNQLILQKAIMENSHIVFNSMAAEKENVINYLREIIGNNKKISIFDIGWKGSLQRGIEQILHDDQMDIQGLYFGLQKDAKFNGSLERAKGYCLNYGHPLAHTLIIQQSVELFELFFYATHASVETVFKNEHNEWQAKLFEVGVSEEKRLHIAKILHQAAQDFTEDLSDIYTLNDIALICRKENILDSILNFAYEPSSKDAKHFIGIDFASAIGDDKGKPLISPLVQSRFHINPSKPISKSRWKNGAKAIVKPKKTQKSHNNIYQWQKQFFNKLIKTLKGKR